MSLSVRNWVSITPMFAPVICHWYSACTVKRRALRRAAGDGFCEELLINVCASELQIAQQADHFQRARGRVGALVAGLGARTFDGLFDTVGGEHAKRNGNAGIQHHAGHALGALASDIIEMRGAAANDRSEGDDG